MKFKPTRKEFHLRDESKYAFDVTLIHDEEYGWEAHVSFSARGYKIEQGALSALQESVEEFLRMLPEAQP